MPIPSSGLSLEMPRPVRRAPNLLVEGFRLGVRNWPCALWTYAVSVVFALLAAVPFTFGLSPYIDHSLQAEKIAGTMDLVSLGELGIQLRDAGSFPMVVRTARWTELLEQAVLFLLLAGTVFVLVTAEPPRLSVMLRGGIAYFWRFVRAALLAGCVALVIVGTLLGLRGWILSRAGEVYVERPMFLLALITGAVVLLAALLVRLWWDVLEIYIVRNAMDGEGRIRQAIAPSLRLTFRHLPVLGGSFLLTGVASLGAFAVCLWLWKLLPAHEVWMAMLLGQLGIFFLLAGRLWQRGLETVLVMSADPPYVIRDELEAEEAGFSPVSELPVRPIEPAAVQAEPTLRDLVLKLQSEPWANAEPAPPEPIREVAPEPPRPEPVTEPYTALLNQHRNKPPLESKPHEERATGVPAPPKSSS
jgi:hypothetical protein